MLHATVYCIYALFHQVLYTNRGSCTVGTACWRARQKWHRWETGLSSHKDGRRKHLKLWPDGSSVWKLCLGGGFCREDWVFKALSHGKKAAKSAGTVALNQDYQHDHCGVIPNLAMQCSLFLVAVLQQYELNCNVFHIQREPVVNYHSLKTVAKAANQTVTITCNVMGACKSLNITCM